MGLLDFFKKQDSNAPKAIDPRELARLTRVVGNKLAQDYDRQEAIGVLAGMASADGARALLKRFDFAMEPSITDQDEKESAAQGIIAAGQAALGPLREYCIRAESVTWPIRILRQIVDDRALVDELVDLLEQFDTEYVRNPEPKIQLINALEEFPSEEVRLAVEPFLQDVNENVRFHAVGTVFAMKDPASAQALIEALLEEESLRVRNRIAGGLEQRGWEVPEALRSKCAERLPDGFVLDAAKLRRG
ncbi:MAG TPA: HEAT repeat domain-containing protein [Polyangiaceae bacterium]|jgi:HEAT repeat protein|nr:HEAT repeat domain-containing protein [Polyangiaceae bacterium]